MHEGVKMKRLFRDPVRDIMLIGLLTIIMVLSGIFDINTIKSLAAVILGSIVIAGGIVIWAEGR